MEFREILRMAQWLALAVSLYFLAISLADAGVHPQIQTVCWKAAHLTLGGFVGYWIDRTAFRMRLSPAHSPLLHIRRAIIVVGAMLAISTGL